MDNEQLCEVCGLEASQSFGDFALCERHADEATGRAELEAERQAEEAGDNE